LRSGILFSIKWEQLTLGIAHATDLSLFYTTLNQIFFRNDGIGQKLKRGQSVHYILHMLLMKHHRSPRRKMSLSIWILSILMLWK
jgi:hypothetical protein